MTKKVKARATIDMGVIVGSNTRIYKDWTNADLLTTVDFSQAHDWRLVLNLTPCVLTITNLKVYEHYTLWLKQGSLGLKSILPTINYKLFILKVPTMKKLFFIIVFFTFLFQCFTRTR